MSHDAIYGPVETMQVAPTIQAALGFDPDELESVRIEHTSVLPGLPFYEDDGDE